MSQRNPWQLYSSMPGWQEASQALDEALATAIKGIHLARAEGVSRTAAEARAYDQVWAVMKRHEGFGATDSEGIHHLEDAIERAR